MDVALSVPNDSTPALLFSVGGLRGRTVAQWRDGLLGAAFPATLGIFIGANVAGVTTAAVLFAIGVSMLLTFWLRGRIELFDDRLIVSRWGFPYAGDVLEMKFEDVRLLRRDGNEIEVLVDRADREVRAYRFRLHPVAAENLCDRMTERMEQRGLRFTTEEDGVAHGSWQWTLDELFPWVENTESGRLRLDPMGSFEAHFDHDRVMRGTRFVKWELHAPGDDPGQDPPALRIENERLMTHDGLLLGSLRVTDASVELVFSSGAAYAIHGKSVTAAGEPVGEFVLADGVAAIDLDTPLHDFVVALLLIGGLDANHAKHSQYEAYVPPRANEPEVVSDVRSPRGAPLLRIETGESTQSNTAMSVFSWVASVLHETARYLKGEARFSSRAAVEFHADLIVIRRAPVVALGEQDAQEFTITYPEVTRFEFVAPETILLGFGVVGLARVEQVVVQLPALEAADRFDEIQRLLEERLPPDHLLSIVENGKLTHSRDWTWEERLPELGMSEGATLLYTRRAGGRTWDVADDSGESLRIVETHGLALLYPDTERVLLQGFQSQLLDGTGLVLSLVERTDKEIAIHTSRDERLALHVKGEVMLRGEVIGSCDPPIGHTFGGDRMPAVFGSAPVITAESIPAPPTRIELDRALPRAWVLALAVMSLLPLGEPKALEMR